MMKYVNIILAATIVILVLAVIITSVRAEDAFKPFFSDPSPGTGAVTVAPNIKGQYPYPYQWPVGDVNGPIWWYLSYDQWLDLQEEIYRRRGAWQYPTKGQQLRRVPSKGALIKY